MNKQLVVFSLDQRLPTGGRRLPTKVVYDDPSPTQEEEIVQVCSEYGLDWEIILLGCEEKAPNGATLICNLNGDALRSITEYKGKALFVSAAPLVEVTVSRDGRKMVKSCWIKDKRKLCEKEIPPPYPAKFQNVLHLAEDKLNEDEPKVYWSK